ncbi:hypothetical protein GMORB2_4771 [Geosmithia morbida]|uniref:Amino acid permease/ SLC12A domain-containing protein n=1 Tax=Geosmithia morbida TaxID=1094350 RepID=A0A9P4YQZ6_9HYPO|nr:uncharacterized protein GMORB2_4771 [Geosmithia morbida]KAF4119429.1 hypothetical protein GMORB2_4771 [Geosmithia morbida]
MSSFSEKVKVEGTVQPQPESSSESATPGTKRGLKPRHSQLIALGGTIGTAVFVGSGSTLAKGGPGFTLIAYVVMSIFVFFIVGAIIMTASYLPVKGATPAYFSRRYVSPSLGWAMGWYYWYSFGILVPYEVTAATLIIDFWNPPVNPAVWITIMIVIIVALNLLPVSVYGETEFYFASLKIVTIIGLLILSFILFWWGGPRDPHLLAFTYWNKPGAFNAYILEGTRGYVVSFFSTLISALLPFSFAPEMLVFCSGEMKSPRRNLPRAARSFMLRIIIFYIGSILAIGIICPSDEPDLTSGQAGASSSPFVLGIRKAGIRGLDSVINAAILTSALSAGNAFIFQSSRGLYSMALNGDAPAIFARCDRRGVPYVAVVATSLFSLLAYMNVNTEASTVFNWLVNLVNTAAFISWVSCAVTALRFQDALDSQGVDRAQLPFTSRFQPWSSYFCIVVFTLLCLINGFTVFLPGSWSTSSFFSSYVGIPIFFILYFGHRFTAGRNDPWAIPPTKVDLHTGLDELKADEDMSPPSPSLWSRIRSSSVARE